MATWVKKNPQSQHVSFSIFSSFSWSFWALPIKITFVSGHILSQNVLFVVMLLIISACTKTWNNKTKRPKRNDRCDWNKTTTTIETSGCWKVAEICRLHFRYSHAFKDFTYQSRHTKLNFFFLHASSWNYNLTLIIICSFQYGTPASLNTEAYTERRDNR